VGKGRGPLLCWASLKTCCAGWHAGLGHSGSSGLREESLNRRPWTRVAGCRNTSKRRVSSFVTEDTDTAPRTRASAAASRRPLAWTTLPPKQCYSNLATRSNARCRTASASASSCAPRALGQRHLAATSLAVAGVVGSDQKPPARGLSAKSPRRGSQATNLVTASDCMMVQPRRPSAPLCKSCAGLKFMPSRSVFHLFDERAFHPNSGADYAAFSKTPQLSLRSGLPFESRGE
jgi:hypothetical protein